MAFKIKDNLDLYGNQLLNFALQSDSGFPQSPQVGHMFNYTGAGVMANHAVMCVDETTKAFKALAFVDEIATNEAFTELAGKVEDIEKALGTDSKDVLDTWAEVQDFLKNINENDADLMTMLNSKLDTKGGEMTGAITMSLDKENRTYPIKFNDASWIGFLFQEKEELYWGHSATAANANLILHSGNIGEHALKTDGSNKMTGGISWDNSTSSTWELIGTGNNNGIRILNTTGASSAGAPSKYAVGLLVSGYYGFCLAYDVSKKSMKINGGSEGFTDWKTIAFTDSTVAAANVLMSKTGVQYSYNFNTDKIFVFGNGVEGYKAYIDGSVISLRYGANNATGFILNSSGNVTIGAEDKAGTSAKLYVDGDIHLGIARLCSIGAPYSASDPVLYNRIAIGSSYDGIKYYSGSWTGDVDKISHEFIVGGVNMSALAITNGGNVGIGTADPKKKLHVVGDLYVDGNIIATKEVSAGGAGQEGESGDGGAEVISQPLAKGQSTYTITNTIKRSDIAVSLYEETVINSQTIWSLCLADIEVTNTTITVTFGSATSVNHKLVAVG